MVRALSLMACVLVCLSGQQVAAAIDETELVEVRLLISPNDLIDDVYDRQMQIAAFEVATLETVLNINPRERPIFAEIENRMLPAQYRSFLKTRSRLLKSAFWLLRPITWNREKLAARMASIDQFVIESADSIATSDRTGIVISFSLSLGLGFSKKIIAKMQSDRLKRLIPESGGFYYVLGAGFGFYVQQSELGRRHLVLDLFLDFDRLTTIHTYAGEVSGAVNWGIAVDKAKSASKEHYDSHYIGILGVIRKNIDHFSYSLITGLALPPYLPVGMIYSNDTARARATVLKVPWFRMRGDRCSEVFQRSETETSY